MVLRANPTNDQRLQSLIKARDAGDLYFVASFSDDGNTVRFSVKATERSETKRFTGTQVDAFLYGIRVGKMAAEGPTPALPQRGN